MLYCIYSNISVYNICAQSILRIIVLNARMPDPAATMDGGPADTSHPMDNTVTADRIPLHPGEDTDAPTKGGASYAEHVPECMTDISNGVRTAAEPLEAPVDSVSLLTELYSFQCGRENEAGQTGEQIDHVYGELTEENTAADAVAVNVIAPAEDTCTPVEHVEPVEPAALEPTEDMADDPMKPDFEYNSLETDEELCERQPEDDDVPDADDLDMVPASPLHVILNAEDDEDEVDATEHDVNAIEDDDFELNALDDDIVQREVEADEDDDEEEEAIEMSLDGDGSEELDEEDEDDRADDLDRSLDEECADVYSPSAVNVDDANEADCIIPDRPQAVRTAKKRRRILAVTSANEDSSSADDCDVADDADGDERLDDDDDDSRLVTERLQQLVQNEKPGPRSKKASTQLLMELQARALLQSAVVVPVAVPVDGKKRKMRILESDDDDDGDGEAAIGVAAVTDSVDDIGAEAEPIDLDAEAEQLIIGGPPPPPLVGHDDEQANAVNVAEMLFLDEVTGSRQEEDDEDEIELKIFIDVIDEALHDLPPASELEAKVDVVTVKAETDIMTSEKQAVKTEVGIPAIEPTATDASPAKVNGDSSRTPNSAAVATSPPLVRVKDEPKPASSSKASGRPTPQRRSLYSESEDEYLPNDVYFGTPDRSDLLRKPRGRGRGSGQSAVSRYEAERCKYEHKQATSTRGRGRGRGRPPGQKSKSYRQQYESDSCTTEASSSSDSDVRHHKANKPKSRGYAHHQPAARRAAGSSTKSAKRKSAGGRFKDKSRAIPNDVYFDAKVPLHVLYSYGTESSEDELPPFPPLSTITGRPLNSKSSRARGVDRGGGGGGRGRGRGRGSSTCNKSTSTAAPPAFNATGSAASKRGRKPGLGTSTSADLRLKHMVRCFRAAGFQKQRLRDLWKDSDTTGERADKLLHLLRDVGLVGDPNPDACRLLRKTVICNEEARELDPSLIIQAEGRTRRSVTAALTAADAGASPTLATASTDAAAAAAAATSDSETNQKTLSSIKRLIDSDSDDE